MRRDFLFDPTLTKGHSPELTHQMSLTRPGMAHLAGSGPAGETCAECERWGYWHEVRHAGHAKNVWRAACAKYRELTGKIGDRVPGGSAACKYFEVKKSPFKR